MKNFFKNDFTLIEVKGKSMDNGTNEAIKNDDKLFCRTLDKTQLLNRLKVGQPDVILIDKNGLHCKRITSYNPANGQIIGHSLNDNYPDLAYNLTEINQIFIIDYIARNRKRK